MNKEIRIAELKEIVENATRELNDLLRENNPYVDLKSYSNQKFGQGWSEPYVASKCPSFIRENTHTGYDFITAGLGKVELKSTRLPCKSTAYNQCHPYECDYFVFIDYDTENGTEDIYCFPAKDLKGKLAYSKQHNYEGAKEESPCVMVKRSKSNLEKLSSYKLSGWEALERLGSGKDSFR